jgi:hypothetical protein
VQRRRIRACICESFSFCFVVRSSNQHKCNRHGNTINTAAAHVLAALDKLNQSAGCPHLLALKHALRAPRPGLPRPFRFNAIKCRHVGVPSPSPAYPAVPCPERHPPPRACSNGIRPATTDLRSLATALSRRQAAVRHSPHDSLSQRVHASTLWQVHSSSEFTSASVSFHIRAASSSSWPCGLGVDTLHEAQYLPVMPFASGCTAR